MSTPMPLSYARRMRRDSTEAELKLWQLLRDPRFGACQFKRQVWLGRYIVDFLSEERMLIVEVNGGQHGTNSAYDARRAAWLAARGYRSVRFWNYEILAMPNAVSEQLWRALESSC
jgi:adenine-specific DNA-methyltransferase